MRDHEGPVAKKLLRRPPRNMDMLVGAKLSL